MTPGEVDLLRLFDLLHQRSALTELAVFVACLALAWGMARLLRGRAGGDGDSVLFGRSIVDGVLFPVLALVFAFGASRLLLAEVPPAVFRLVLPVLVSLVVIRVTVGVLHAAFPQSRVTRLVGRGVSWVAWIAVVLWITGVMPLIGDWLEGVRWKVGNTRVSLLALLQGSISALVVLVLALWLSNALEARLLRGAVENLSMRKMAANALRALLLFVGLMFALSAAGIDLTALGVLGGALGVGIGLGLQKLAANYVSGFVILAERSVRIGDMVSVDGFEGRITNINTRYTVIRALDGRESIVPNEMLTTQRVENLSLADPNVAVGTDVQVAYGTDLRALVPRLQAAVRSVPRVLAEPAPAVQLASFGADGLNLHIGFWIGDPQGGQGNVRSDVNLAILEALDQAGIEIPFPQRVLRHAPEEVPPDASARRENPVQAPGGPP
ncbi:MAG TPA: mechanosensitive ion channel domain-containing protein [Burkholderiaceae bacterium]